MYVFLINLRQCSDRLNEMKIKLQNYNLELRVLEAVDGRSLSRNQIRYIERYPKPETGDYYVKSSWPLPPGAVGCFLSHREAYRIMMDENIDRALILEDDCIFSDRFSQILAALDNIKQNWHLVHLISGWYSIIRPNKFHEEKLDENLFVSLRMSQVAGAILYMMSNSYARELIEATKTVSLAIDVLLFEHPFTIRWPHAVYSYNEQGAAEMTAGTFDKTLQSFTDAPIQEKNRKPLQKKPPETVYTRYSKIFYPLLKKYLNISHLLKYFPQKNSADFNIYDYQKMGPEKRAIIIIKSIDWLVFFKFWNKKNN